MRKKFLTLLSVLFLLMCTFSFAGCRGCSKAPISYQLDSTLNVIYDEHSDTSTVQVSLYLKNPNQVSLKNIDIVVCFTDDENNLIDKKEGSFSINLDRRTRGTYNLAFEGVKGAPTKAYVLDFEVEMETLWERLINFVKQWWLIVSLAYIGIGVAIGIACGKYVDVTPDLTEGETWLAITCGLFWPIGGIILLVVYWIEAWS